MPNIFRFVLAILVVIAHLAEGVKFFSHWGVFAVFGFYIISGYLITLILNNSYGFRLGAFALNRFLRLFPIYYMVVAITLLAFYVLPGANEFHPAWNTRFRFGDMLGNALIFPFEFYDATFRISPPTWSVAVELVNYFLLWLIVARSRNMAVAAVLLSVLYHAVSLVSGDNWMRQYLPFYAAMLPFALGACIYFFRSHFENKFGKHVGLILIGAALLFISNLIYCGMSSGPGEKHFSLFFYVNLVSLTILVMCITSGQFQNMRGAKILGDLAYPVFLTHWVAAYVVSRALLDGERRGISLLALSIIPILALSYLLVYISNKWLEPLRDKVRNGVKRNRN